MQAAHSVVVPPTLQDSLMFRLDRLGDAKEIAQVASVIGRQFSYRAAGRRRRRARCHAKGSPEPAARCRPGVQQRDQDRQQGDYSFNDALVQEAAYQSLSRSRRQALHLSIAEILESHQETAAASAPEIVAYHFDRAAQPERSCAFWMLAAEKSGRRSAHAEALANLNAALTQAERITDPTARARCKIEAQLKLGATFNIQVGPLSPDMASVLEQAYALAKEAHSERQLFQATWGLYITAANSRGFDRAFVLGEELLDISRKLDDDDLLVEGLHHRWGIWYFTGQTEKMLQATREGLRRYESQRHHRLAHVFGGHDLGVCAHCCSAIGHGLAGLAQHAAASLDAALALAESVQHPFSLTFALGVGSVALQLAGDVEACKNVAQREMQVAQKYDLPLQQGLGQFMFGLARTQQDDIAAGLAMMEANHETAVRHSFLGVYPHVVMVEALARAGRGKEAFALVTRTFETLISPEVGIHVPELWRLRAELALADSAANAPLARGWLRTAARIASDQGATVYQARAESALERLPD